MNAVVILAAMVLLAEPKTASIETRKQVLFSIMDFNGLGKISQDELVQLPSLLCLVFFVV